MVAGGGGRGPLRVAVLLGGPSEEREVSLMSGRAVLAALDPARYDARAVEVSPDGAWTLPPADVAVLALHGRFGEDGTVQRQLEAAGVPYTGSGVRASALAMDKGRARAAAARAGLRVARGATVTRRRWERAPDAVLEALAREPGFPAFAKPRAGGSSIGAGPAEDPSSLRARIEAAFAGPGDAVLVEERLLGREVTCAALGNRGEETRTFPVVEIRPRGRAFFDYEAKYDPGACEEICPAGGTEAESRRVAEAARIAHRALGCDGMSRSDFILRDGEPWYLETNTIPGMTENSLCPKAARAAGVDFPRLLDLLVEMALRRPRRGRRRGEAA